MDFGGYCCCNLFTPGGGGGGRNGRLGGPRENWGSPGVAFYKGGGGSCWSPKKRGGGGDKNFALCEKNFGGKGGAHKIGVDEGVIIKGGGFFFEKQESLWG